MNSLWRLVLTVLALSTIGCADARFMQAAHASPAIVPLPDRATVVFVRPGIFAFSLVPVIVDGERRFIGELPTKSWFATSMSPGKHTFVVFADDQHVMQANLQAGRIYVVEVPITFRVSIAGTGRPNLCVVRPSDSDWSEVTSWLGMRRLEPRVMEGQRHIERHARQIEQRIVAGYREAAELDPSDTCRREVAPGDGFAGVLRVPISRSASE